MKVLITGGAGFIGSHIAEELKRKYGEDIKISCYDNLSVGKKDNIPEGVKFIEGDILDPSWLSVNLKDVDICFHMAAFVSIRASFENNLLKKEEEMNTIGTLNVIEACVKNKVKKLIIASSMAVYGEPKKTSVAENDYLKPMSPYGVSKYKGEVYSDIVNKKGDLQIINLRYFNTYGIKQTPTSYVGVITIFINQALKGEAMTLFGSGDQSRDFIHVKDIARASVMAAESGKAGVYNVGSGKEYTINQIAKMIQKEIKGSKIKYIAATPGEIRRMCANIGKIKKELGFIPEKKLDEEIVEIIKYWRNNK